MFNVGDIVTGTAVNGYLWTTNSAIMRVVGILPGNAQGHARMLVECISSPIVPPGTQAPVQMRHFVLVEGQSDREDLSVWVDTYGRGTPFKEMTMAHLTNVIAMLHRGEGKKSDQRSKLVTLEKELLRRLKGQYELSE